MWLIAPTCSDRGPQSRLPTAYWWILAPALLLLAACSDTTPTAAPAPSPTPHAPSMSYYGSYPDAGVLTSTGDSCPWYTTAPELETAFWSGADEDLVSNPDSIYAADSVKVMDPNYWVPMMLLDPYTGAEMYAGPCEVEYNRCNARCRRLRIARVRAICWGACTLRYGQCRMEEERRRNPPDDDPPACGTQLVYDPDQPCDDPGSPGGSGGTAPTGGSSSCHTEWVVVEVNDGSGWSTWWEGYAIVCN